MTFRYFLFFLGAILVQPLAAAEKSVLRVGYFPNITHAQGLIGSHSTRQGHGWFESRLGPDVTVQWFAYNAGPSAMEAMLAGSIDLTYVGPNPALNVYIRSRGDEIRILAGAAEGGVALVVQGDGRISKPADFKGRTVATPQLGNTQDVAARRWLSQQGFRVTFTGGEVLVLPTANADQLPLFLQGKIDAAWTVEPWVTRLEQEGKGKVFLEQPDAVTTVLVAGVKVLKERAPLAAAFLAAHRELTAWLGSHPDEAMAQVRSALTAESRREIDPDVVRSAWKRLRFTDQLAPGRVESLVADAQKVGFLRDAIPLARLFSAKP
jgi:NitT/TauT family transport system substrate-binding protein